MSLGVLRACAVLGAIGAGATLLAFELLGHLLPGMDWLMAGALAAAVPFALVWRIAPQAALAERAFRAIRAVQRLPSLLACPLSVGLALIGGVKWAVVGLAVAFVLTGSVIAIWLLREGHRQRAESRSPAGGTRAVVSFGARVWARAAPAAQSPGRPHPARSVRRRGRERRVFRRPRDHRHRPDAHRGDGGLGPAALRPYACRE